MRSSRIALGLLLLAGVSMFFTEVGDTSSEPASIAYHGVEPVAAPPGPERGIKEDVPAKYHERYEAWKAEFLATEIGREQWDHFAKNPNFTLTISVSRENAEGATTGGYRWNDQ